MELVYHIDNPVWKKWPLVKWCEYPDGDISLFRQYDPEYVREDLQIECRRLGLRISNVIVFYSNPNTKFSPIHIDGFEDFGRQDDELNSDLLRRPNHVNQKGIKRRQNCAINWSYVENPATRWKLAWWEPLGEHAKYKFLSEYEESNALNADTYDYTYTRYRPEYCTKIFEYTWATDPVIIKTDVPHNVIMTRSGKRWSASMRFESGCSYRNYTFDSLKNLFELDKINRSNDI